jgi:ligand-binding sensor domain-containing protein/serine phosphatase RsbU (regulator of sigma subunit)
LVTFIISGWHSALMSLDPQKAITQYKLDIWRMERGFEQNGIHALLQTRDGYIWLGTLDGLVRFDGIRFKVFDKTNTEGLKGNNVRALFQDRRGVLWIGTDGGVCCLKDGKFAAYTLAEEVHRNTISAIFEDHRGTIWIGTFYGGVISINNGTCTTYTSRDGLASDYVYTVYEDKSGNLWFGTSAGLSKRTPAGRFVTYNREKGLECDYVYSLCERKNGELWIGADNGLYLYVKGVKSVQGLKNERFIHYGIKAGLPNIQVMCLYEDRNRNLWGGTDGGGLIRLKEGKIETLSCRHGMACGFVYSFCEDREGSLWFGTLEGGLHRLRDTIIATYTSLEGLVNDEVNCIYEDRHGNIRIGTNGGLNRLQDGQSTLEFTTRQGLLSNIVSTILEDKTGALWIGTQAGLHRFSQGKLTAFTMAHGLSHNQINALVEDRHGGLRIATPRGLNRFDKSSGKFTLFSGVKDPLNQNIHCLYEDRTGNLWFGTEKGDLYCLKGGENIHYTPIKGLTNNSIECIYQDEDGILYIGTRVGLIWLEGGKFTNCTTQDGLVDNFLYTILDDGRGNLWFGSRKGIFHVSKEELRDFGRGKIKKIHPTAYSEQDGMRTRWCNSNGANLRDGSLWFPTTKGIAMINPANIIINKHPPPVMIEELKVDGEYVDSTVLRSLSRKGEELVLPPGKKRLEFYYTGLSFVKPRLVKFKLKLEGYDRDWIDAGNARSTIYTGLPPGDYTLRVTACNSDGVRNETGDSFSFVMKPDFYQTTWFYIFVVLFVVLIVFSGYRFRVRQLKVREKKLQALVEVRTRKLNERTREVQEAHDSLRKSKQLIEEKSRHIFNSIEYARRIQQAILPTDEQILTAFSDHFILFKPRDIVSGDFYWLSQRDNKYFIAVVDCTGHGVPGAFLSMIANMKLNDIIYEEFLLDPAGILLHLDLGVRRLLQMDKRESEDDSGMEVGLCMIDLKQSKIIFAGAKRPMYYIKNSQFFELRGDKRSVGGRRKIKGYTFTSHEIDIREETTIYLCTDGFADQNNHEDRKYGSRQLKKFLHAHAHLPMAEQKEALFKELKRHQGSEEQRDDITIIGIKLIKSTNP